MEKKTAQSYETPSTEIIELSQEGVVCASEVRSGNSINNWNNGGTSDDELFM